MSPGSSSPGLSESMLSAKNKTTHASGFSQTSCFLTDLKAGGPSSTSYQLPYLLRATSWLMSPPKVTFHQIIYPVHWGTTVMMSVHPKGPISSSLDYKIAGCEFGPHLFSTEQRPIVLDTRKAALALLHGYSLHQSTSCQ